MKLMPSPLGLPDPAAINGLGFVDTATGPLLLGSTLGPPRPRLFDLQRPNGTLVAQDDRTEFPSGLANRMGAVQWHACRRSDGSTRVVMSDPLSASSGIAVHSSTQADEIDVTHRYPLGVFFRPRWIRGASERDSTLIAIDTESNEPRIVRFCETAERTYGELAVAHTPAEGRIEAVELVRSGLGYVLLFKSYRPSVAARTPGAPHRTDAAHTAWFAGTMFALELDQRFEPIGEVRELLKESTTFDFDADCDCDDIFALATTASGLMLWKWSRSTGAANPTVVASFDSLGPLTQPRISVNGGIIHYAAIESALSTSVRVLVGRHPVP